MTKLERTMIVATLALVGAAAGAYFALRRERWEGVAALALLHHELGPRGMLALFPSGARAPERVPGSVWLRRRAGRRRRRTGSRSAGPTPPGRRSWTSSSTRL